MEITVSEWMDETFGPGIVWFVKRLSGNDTLANESHQAGPYIPKEFLFGLFPEIHRPEAINPDTEVSLAIESDADYRDIRVVWYNSKVRNAGTRNETRFTRLGGMASTLLDPESTGALTVFAFHLRPDGTAEHISVWVCRSEIEEDLVEEVIGPINPGQWRIWSATSVTDADELIRQDCWLCQEDIPDEWKQSFPSGAEIVEKAVSMRRGDQLDVDERLTTRRVCEFEIFRSIEEAFELERIKQGYNSIDLFVQHAQTILQRRRSRAGRSLELHLKAIFEEENLVEDTDFSYQPETENGNTPDFLFPSLNAYRDSQFNEGRLKMLAVKTTCKDRWRQVLNEAQRINKKHLFTLQEGVSKKQFHQMQEAGLTLVVPKGIFKAFHKDIRPHLMSLESFLGDVRLLKL
ncbi:type II restriction endonuclease [Marinobacter subterrani]|uniref:Restriction endonuclease EcoRII, N-terminal/EcoRII C terminal n=1 Tax=Marinobacter subterrani TaxID=1658765 RepID=A0A0J7JER5_9GAMM|nr:type II restriction endonuclease [Marinobacter subterrani]KMQ76394.1 Restriction endonuclease EcoRII, N-terminal/EcoRII C terminal [Marinobacter subterrani]